MNKLKDFKMKIKNICRERLTHNSKEKIMMMKNLIKSQMIQKSYKHSYSHKFKLRETIEKLKKSKLQAIKEVPNNLL